MMPFQRVRRVPFQRVRPAVPAGALRRSSAAKGPFQRGREVHARAQKSQRAYGCARSGR